MNTKNDKFKEFKKLSHDIQNILLTIVNNAVLLKQNTAPNTPLAKYAEIIENNSMRASEIIQEFLSNNNTQKRKIDTSILFNDIINSSLNNVPSNIKVNFVNGDPGNIIYGNYTELFRAFLNLLINATEAISGDGIIDFESTVSNKNISISVRDNGCGIHADIINNIFESGFSTKDKGRESGFGLKIVKEIIENHNGKIEVKSAVNKGTEFLITLPLFIEDKNSGQNKKILIADDDNNLRETLSELFDSFGFTSFQAKDGDDVLNFINNKNEIDLLIIDYKMPKLTGLKCIEEIRNRKINFPIILVTGVNLDEAEIDEINDSAGINKIVKKPYDFVYLKGIVESLIL